MDTHGHQLLKTGKFDENDCKINNKMLNRQKYRELSYRTDRAWFIYK